MADTTVKVDPRERLEEEHKSWKQCHPKVVDFKAVYVISQKTFYHCTTGHLTINCITYYCWFAKGLSSLSQRRGWFTNTAGAIQFSLFFILISNSGIILLNHFP